MTEIAARLHAVRQRIARAAEAANRDPDSVRLLAVSKLHPVSAIREAFDAGQRDFGENYAQELASKAEELALPDIRFHMIGHVQTNKAKLVAEHAHAVHSIDSVRIAQALGTRVAAAGRPAVDAWIEVNLEGEVGKSGARAKDVAAVIEAVRGEKSLVLRGLMTMPPAGDLTVAERVFRALVRLREEHGGAVALPELSMGMSEDLEVAIACGATIVRVGTAIFGAR